MIAILHGAALGCALVGIGIAFLVLMGQHD